MLLNRAWQAYLNLSLVSPRHFLIHDTASSTPERRRCHMNTKPRLTRKESGRTQTGNLLFVAQYPLNSPALIKTPLLPPNLHANSGSLVLKIQETCACFRQGTGAFIWCNLSPKRWLSCGAQRTTPLTFNSNSWCLAAGPEHGIVHHLNRRVLSWLQIYR